MNAELDWNRERRREREVLERLQRSCFEIKLDKPYWGTAFFFAPDLAFTADHNVRTAGCDEFDGFLGMAKIKLRWEKEWSSREADIAVLRLVDNPLDVHFDALPVRYLGPLVSPRDQESLLGRRKVAIWGYPCSERPGQEAGYVIGFIDPVQPLTSGDEKSGNGLGDENSFIVRRLNIQGNTRGVYLPGISGAPVYDFDWDYVIGVQGSCTPDGKLVRASAVYELLGRLLEQQVDCSELRQHIKSLSGEERHPTTGIAVLSRVESRPGIQLVPISLRFSAASQPDAEVACNDNELLHLAKSAISWAGEYCRRFSGALGSVIFENHWGKDRPYSLSTFSLPLSRLGAREAVHAGMCIAWLAKVLRDTLVHDLKLPVAIPPVMILCACGFDPGSENIAGVDDFAYAIEHYPVDAPARVLYARTHQRQLINASLPQNVTLVPIDSPTDMARVLLGSVLDVFPSASIQVHLQTRFTQALDELIHQERSIREAKAALRGREQQLFELHMRLEVAKKEEEYLALKVAEVKQARESREDLPLISAVAEELVWMRQRWLSEAGLLVLVEPSTEEEQKHLDACHQLYRRLALFVHPDHYLAQGREPEGLPEALRFTALKEHDQDILYLRALEGALDPCGGTPVEPIIEDEVSRLFDRLFELRESYQDLRQRIAEKKAEADSYGNEWKAHLDDTIEQATRAVRVQDSYVDALWWELQWRLGHEPSLDNNDRTRP